MGMDPMIRYVSPNRATDWRIGGKLNFIPSRCHRTLSLLKGFVGKFPLPSQRLLSIKQ